jgi:hypothetical protein
MQVRIVFWLPIITVYARSGMERSTHFFRFRAHGSNRLKQFQEKWEPVFRPELRQNKRLKQIPGKVGTGFP